MKSEPNRWANHRTKHRVRVRYCETDQMGVAHHGGHIDWIEEARTEWMRECGTTYRDLEASGSLLQVVDVQVSYRASVTYDDVVRIECWLAERKRVSLTIGYRLTREADGVLVADASTTLACVDRSGKLRRLPEDVFGAE